jgi:hypothetical protein
MQLALAHWRRTMRLPRYLETVLGQLPACLFWNQTTHLLKCCGAQPSDALGYNIYSDGTLVASVPKSMTNNARTIPPLILKHDEPTIAILVQFRLKFCMAFGSLTNVPENKCQPKSVLHAPCTISWDTRRTNERIDATTLSYGISMQSCRIRLLRDYNTRVPRQSCMLRGISTPLSSSIHVLSRIQNHIFTSININSSPFWFRFSDWPILSTP